MYPSCVGPHGASLTWIKAPARRGAWNGRIHHQRTPMKATALGRPPQRDTNGVALRAPGINRKTAFRHGMTRTNTEKSEASLLL